MSEEEEGTMFTRIYVYPTEEGKPPRAKVQQLAQAGEIVPFEGEEGMGMVNVELIEMEAMWSRDAGTWVNGPNAIPLPEDLADSITAHAKELGVEW